MNLSMRFEGYVERIINEAVRQGIVKTKAEALRVGLLELNDKYVLVPPLDQMEDAVDAREVERIESRIRAGKERVHKVRSVDDLFK